MKTHDQKTTKDLSSIEAVQKVCFEFVTNGYPHLALNTTSAISSNTTPTSVALLSNYPNPFNPATTINFELNTTGYAKLAVYNAKGELIRTLVSGIKTAGKHNVNFDATALNSGIYFYKLETAGQSLVNKMVLSK